MQPLKFYRELRHSVAEIAKGLEKNLTKAVESKFDEEIIEDIPHFFYFNNTNLAIMHSVSLSKQELTTEV